MLYYFMEDLIDKSENKITKLTSLLYAKDQQLQSKEILLVAKSDQITYLQEQLAWFKKQIFGTKSEKLIDIPGENPELPGLELPDEVVVESDEDKKHVEYDRKGKNRKNGTCTLELPDNLPVETIIKDIPEEERFDTETGEALVEIGSDSVDKLACKPGHYYIKRYIYKKYAVRNNSLGGIIQAQAEDSILRGSKFDESFMAEVVTEKLSYHMPFYRQQEKLACLDIKIERQSLSALFVNLGTKIERLYKEMKKVAFEYGYLFTDDTPVRMLSPGSGKTKEARMWIYEVAKPNAPPYRIYEFSVNRNHEHTIKTLSSFNGIIHADAFPAYITIDKDAAMPVTWSGCWAHMRRKFIEAQAGDQELKSFILKMIRNLFRYEKIAWNTSAENRLKIRSKCEKPIVDQIFERLKHKITTEILRPKEKLTVAIKYALRYEKNFRKYLDDSNLKMDNNAAERSMRKIVIGKKNWMFVWSPNAGKSMAILYSFVQTCRIMKINPQEYLEDIFRRLQSYPHKNLMELLPDQWLIAKNKKNLSNT